MPVEGEIQELHFFFMWEEILIKKVAGEVATHFTFNMKENKTKISEICHFR